MNLSLDGYIAAPGDDIGWSVPSDELFQWGARRVGGGAAGGGGGGGAGGGKRRGGTTPPRGPPAAERRGPTGGELGSPRRWRDMPKVVFSSTTSTVDWNTRLVTGDAVTEIT